MSISPYHISVKDSEIERLKEKLALSSFPDELDQAAWDYGAPLKDVKRLAASTGEKQKQSSTSCQTTAPIFL